MVDIRKSDVESDVESASELDVAVVKLDFEVP